METQVVSCDFRQMEKINIDFGFSRLSHKQTGAVIVHDDVGVYKANLVVL